MRFSQIALAVFVALATKDDSSSHAFVPHHKVYDSYHHNHNPNQKKKTVFSSKSSPNSPGDSSALGAMPDEIGPRGRVGPPPKINVFRNQKNGFLQKTQSVRNTKSRLDVMPDDNSPRGRAAPVDNNYDQYSEAYEQWCSQYGKQYDASRFPIFRENMREMEAYQKETGQRLRLNEFSDLSTREFNAKVMTDMNPPHFSSRSNGNSPSGGSGGGSGGKEPFTYTPTAWPSSENDSLNAWTQRDADREGGNRESFQKMFDLDPIGPSSPGNANGHRGSPSSPQRNNNNNNHYDNNDDDYRDRETFQKMFNLDSEFPPRNNNNNNNNNGHASSSRDGDRPTNRELFPNSFDLEAKVPPPPSSPSMRGGRDNDDNDYRREGRKPRDLDQKNFNLDAELPGNNRLTPREDDPAWKKKKPFTMKVQKNNSNGDGILQDKFQTMPVAPDNQEAWRTGGRRSRENKKASLQDEGRLRDEQDRLRSKHQDRLKAEQGIRQERLRKEQEQSEKQSGPHFGAPIRGENNNNNNNNNNVGGGSSGSGNNGRMGNPQQNEPDQRARIDLSDNVQTFGMDGPLHPADFSREERPRRSDREEERPKKFGLRNEMTPAKLSPNNVDFADASDIYKGYGTKSEDSSKNNNRNSPQQQPRRTGEDLNRNDFDKRTRLNLDDQIVQGGTSPGTRPNLEDSSRGFAGTRPNEPFGEIKALKIQNRQSQQMKKAALKRDDPVQRDDVFQQDPLHSQKASFRRNMQNKPEKKRARLDQQDEALRFETGELKRSTETATGKSDLDRMESTYRKWCQDFDKEYDERRLPIFAENLRASQAYEKTTGKKVALNMFSDLTNEEFQELTVEEKARLSAPVKKEARKETRNEGRRLTAEQARIEAEAEAKLKEEMEAERQEIERVREAYATWCAKHDKDFDERRVNNFAKNFYKMEKYQKATGKTMDLNEHSDLTDAEYKEVQAKIAKEEEERIMAEVEAKVRQEEDEKRKRQAEAEMKARAAAEARIKVEQEALEKFEENARRKLERMEQSLFDLNAVYKELAKSDESVEGSDSSPSKNKMHKVRHAYKEWCKFYEKDYDLSRLNVFASNAKKVEAYHDKTGISMKLNGYADRTAEEYREMQLTNEMALRGNGLSKTPVSFSDADAHRSGAMDLKRIRNAYAEWCVTHGKEYDEVRFVNFANNMKQMELYQKSTGKKVELNEYSDLTVAEYAEMMRNREAEGDGKTKRAKQKKSLVKEADLIRVSGGQSDKARNNPEFASGVPTPGSRQRVAPPLRQDRKDRYEIEQEKEEESPSFDYMPAMPSMPSMPTGETESEAEMAHRLISIGPEDPRLAEAAAAVGMAGTDDNFLMKEEVNMRDVSIGKGVDSYNNQFPENVVIAYKDFCKQHGKQYDPSRLPNFQYNYLAAQSFVDRDGSPMELNEFADCSQEEYKAMMKNGPPPPKAAAPERPMAAAPRVAQNKPRVTQPEPPMAAAPMAQTETPQVTPQAPQEPRRRGPVTGVAGVAQRNAQTNTPVKKPKIVFHEEPIDSAQTFPSTAELYKLRMEEEMRMEEEEEARILKQAEEEYFRSMRGDDEPTGEDTAAAETQRRAEEDTRLREEEEQRIKEEIFAQQKAEIFAQQEAERIAEEEAATRTRAEEDAKLRAEVEAKVRAELQAEMKAEEEARLKIEEEARMKAEVEAKVRAEEAERLRAHREKERIKAEAEARILYEEEARKREEEAMRERAEEEREKKEAEARLKAEVEAKLRAEEEERRQRQAEAKARAEAEARRMAENASRQSANWKLDSGAGSVFEPRPAFVPKGSAFADPDLVGVEAEAADTKPKLSKVFQNLSGMLKNEDAGLDSEIFSSEADKLLAEAKKIAEKEEARIRQIKAETEEWKNIQKSLELEAAARDRGREKTARMPKQSSNPAVVFKPMTAPQSGDMGMAEKQTGPQTVEDPADANSLLSVFDGLMYVLGDTDDETIGTAEFKAAEDNREGEEVEAEVVPVLSRWTQNPYDRSITGYVRNSPEFENGSEITISTVRRNVKPGTVVTTLSGKQYKLI